MLLAFLLLDGFITLKLWPTDQATRGAFFWHLLISAPVVLWLVAFGIRWLVWLVAEWQADGWDSEREADITAETERGQRYLVLAAVSIRLPHVVKSEALAEQFMLPQAVVLPVVVDEVTGSVTNQARFSDQDQPGSVRILALLLSLLEDIALKAELSQRKAAQKLPTVIQIDSDIELLAEDLDTIKNKITLFSPVLSEPDFLPQFSLDDIDRLLDNRRSANGLLILSVRVLKNPCNGDAEAGVALFLQGMKKTGIYP